MVFVGTGRVVWAILGGMAMAITFLGTGTSQGIPLIGCDCAVCGSDDPRDRRTRTSALVSIDGRNVLIDASPELRLQCLANDVRRLDAVLVTHTHADHICGLDDVRRFNQMQAGPLDLYVGAAHLASLEKVFGYARADRAAHNVDLPQLVFHEVDSTFELFGERVEALVLPHGRFTVLGYRLGPLGYCTDLSRMPEEALARLRGVEVMVLGALRPDPHPAHLSLDEAVGVARQIGASRTYFVHMSHHVGHAAYDGQLPEGMQLAYDGLRVQIQADSVLGG